MVGSAVVQGSEVAKPLTAAAIDRKKKKNRNEWGRGAASQKLRNHPLTPRRRTGTGSEQAGRWGRSEIKNSVREEEDAVYIYK